MKKVLITYYTKTGTTKITAKKIKEVLSKDINEVEMMNIDEVASLDYYDVVIIGTPINGMQPAEKAKKFIADYMTKLREKEVYFFALSYIQPQGRKFWKNRIENSVKEVQNKLQAKDTKIFGGAIDEPMPKFISWVFGIKKDAALDLRNDADILHWSQEILKSVKLN